MEPRERMMLKPNISLALLVGIPLAVCLMSLLLVGGCGKKPPVPPAPPKEAAVPEEEAAPSTVDAFLDAAKGNASAVSADNLGKLYVPGLVLLLVAVAVKFLFGSWRDAFIAAGLGGALSAGAVLLTDYSRVVLLIPACGLAILIACGIRKVVEWRTGFRAWRASAGVIEEADTGPQSTGQRIKNTFKTAGLGPVLDPALKPLEKLWKKQQESRTSQE